MKTIYIPKGETVHYESLSTDHLIVEGTLEVTYGVVAKQIDGDGVRAKPVAGAEPGPDQLRPGPDRPDQGGRTGKAVRQAQGVCVIVVHSCGPPRSAFR